MIFRQAVGGVKNLCNVRIIGPLFGNMIKDIGITAAKASKFGC